MDVVGDEVVVRYEGEWCADTRVAMTGVRLPPASGPPPAEYLPGADVEVYDKLIAPCAAYWKATVKVIYKSFYDVYSLG